MKKLIVLLAALTMTSYAHAENIAIVGGEVHTMTSQGVIEKWHCVVVRWPYRFGVS